MDNQRMDGEHINGQSVPSHELDEIERPGLGGPCEFCSDRPATLVAEYSQQPSGPWNFPRYLAVCSECHAALAAGDSDEIWEAINVPDSLWPRERTASDQAVRDYVGLSNSD